MSNSSDPLATRLAAAKAAIERARQQAAQVPVTSSPWFDKSANVSSIGIRRKLHAFDFHDHVDRFLKKEEPVKVEEDFKMFLDHPGTVSSSQSLTNFLPPPEEYEWWDMLPITDISGVIEYAPLVGNDTTMTRPEKVRLTRQESDKLRKLVKREKVQETQDKIRMGVIPPPEPKVRLANLMRVLGSSAVADPSQVEAQVRAQVERRLVAHLQANEDRKLSPEAKRAKNIQKWTTGEWEKERVAVFLIDLRKLEETQVAMEQDGRQLTDTGLISNIIRFKITKNAQQFHLSGIAIAPQKNSMNNAMVIVEGKPKSIKRFERLMLRRIQWSGRNDIDEEEEDFSGDRFSKGQSPDGVCTRIWTGFSEKTSFWKFRWCEVEGRDEAEVRLREAASSQEAAKYIGMLPS